MTRKTERNRRGGERWRAALGVAGLLALSACAPERAGTPGAPVVLISIDTLRSDRLPAYGYAAGDTPAIDRLAAESLVFERVYSHYPMTLPSHASILTGLLPPRHGVRDNLGFRLDDSHPTLAERLSGAGYATFGAVSSMVLRESTGIGRGFATWDDEIGRSHRQSTLAERDGREAVDAALRWLDDRPADRPFFLFVHLFEPHAPYSPPEPWRSRLADAYDGEVAYADRLVEALLERLRARGLYDGALIVLLSDHGEGLGDHGEVEHGLTLYRETLQVPLLLKLPGGRRAGERVAGEAMLADIVPTVLDALALPPAAGLAGRSLLDPSGADREIYGETLFPRLQYGWSDMRSVIRGGLHWIDAPRPELFDLAADPAERDNLIHRRDPPPSFVDALAAIGAGASTTAAVSDEELRQLASLGYVGGAGSAAGDAAIDPKDRVADVEALRAIGRWRPGDPPLPTDARIAELLALAGGDRESSRRSTARALLRAGRLESAWALLEPLAASDDPETLILVGEAATSLGRFKAAEAGFERALSLDPGHAGAQCGKGILLMTARRFDAARPWIERAVEADPERVEAWNALGVLRARAGDGAGAIEAWSRAVELDPELADAWFNLALARHESGDRDGTAEALRRYIALARGPERARAEALLRSLAAEE